MAPRLHYFLVRPEQQAKPGTTGLTRAIVPLIPVDQLPAWMEIAGVPRTLTMEQTGGMSNLGAIPRGEEVFDVRLHRETLLLMLRGGDFDAESTSQGDSDSGLSSLEDAGAPENMVTDGSNRANSTSGKGLEVGRSTTGPARTAAGMAQPPQRHPSERMLSASRHAAESSATRATAAAPLETPALYRADPSGHDKAKPTVHQPKEQRGIAPPRSSSNYCRHWCHHGTCKWGLLCRYQHSMPTTLAGLQEVGLKDFPRWWTTAMGLTLAGALSTGGLNRMGAFGVTNHKETRKMRSFMATVTQAQLQLHATRAGASTVDPRAFAETSILDEGPSETTGTPKLEETNDNIAPGGDVPAPEERTLGDATPSIGDGPAQQQSGGPAVDSDAAAKLVDI